MDAARCVADKGDPLVTKTLGIAKPERVGEAGAFGPHIAEKITKPVLEFFLEDGVRCILECVCDGVRFGPDKGGPIVRKWQDGEGARWQEVFISYAIMRL